MSFPWLKWQRGKKKGFFLKPSLRRMLDPFPMFPLEMRVNNEVYSCNMEACNVYLHNAKEVELSSMVLVRDRELQYSALRLQFNLPIVWTTGYYYL